MTSSTFAAAQQRILARRAQRQSEAENRVSAPQSQHASRLREILPFPFASLNDRGLKAWDTIKGRKGTRPAFRVGQIDAELLDEELLQLFKGQVAEGLKYFSASIREDYVPEIFLGLRLLLFKSSIWDHSASYGATLQNLHYVDARHTGPVPKAPSRLQKVLYGISTIGGRYGWQKWEDYLADQERDYESPRGPSLKLRLLKRVTDMASTVHSAAAFISFLIFLYNGRYRTLTDRILGLRLAPKAANVSRQVSFEYLNRQLVWHAFTEFLLFLLPLVGISKWRRWLARAWRHAKGLLRGGSLEGEEMEQQQGELYFLPERTCAICFRDQNPVSSGTEADILASSRIQGGIVGNALTDITNPYETVPCGCVYCFVCIATKLEGEEGEGWICLRCGILVKECKPWSGDVIEEPMKKPAKVTKSVNFSDKEKGHGEDNDDDGDTPGESENNHAGKRTTEHLWEDEQQQQQQQQDSFAETGAWRYENEKGP